MVAVRRRKRRRRRTIEPIEWRRIILLLVAFGLAYAVLKNPISMGSLKQLFRGSIPQAMGRFSLEMAVLLLSLAILIYLTPGVEDRLIQYIKNKRDSRRRATRRRR
jgi:hypothetical protein